MTSQTIWGATNLSTATATMRLPADTSNSSGPGYLSVAELGTFFTGSAIGATGTVTDGKILIGSTSTGGLALANITAGSNITITNSGGGITIAATGGGAPGFDTITTGTNTTAAMTVGTGGSLAASGSGSITATAMAASGLTGTTLPSGITASSLTSVGTLTGGATGAGFTINFGTSTQSGVVGATHGGAGTVTGIMKANGSGTVSAAASGTDYAPATSGASILYGNSSGGFSNVTVGTGLSFSGGTLTATGGGSGQSAIQFQTGGSNIGTSGSETVVNFSTGLSASESGGTVTVTASGGASAFNSLTSGTNTTAAMIVGSGSTLAASGSGTIAATSCTGNSATVTTNANLTGPITSSGNATTLNASAQAIPNGWTATTQTALDNSTKLATTAYTDSAVTAALNGLDYKQAVGYATTANVVGVNVAGVFTYTATGTDTIDGHTLVLSDVVLFKNQTTAADNGIWVVTTAGSLGVAGVLTRRSDYNTAVDIQPGDYIPVLNGTANGGTAWVQTATVTTINSSSLAFSQIAGPGSYVAGTGLTLTGNSFAVNTSQNISTLSNLTSNGLVKTSGGTGSLSIATSGTDYVAATTGSAIQKASSGNLTAATAGTDYVAPGTVTAYTAQQYAAEATLTDASPIAWNLNTQQASYVLLTSAIGSTRQLQNPTNIQNGASYTLVVQQSSTGTNALTYGTSYKFPGGTAPTLSTANNAIDILTFIGHNGLLYGVSQLAFS